MEKKIRALGIMNGTSLDAIDYALIEASSDLKSLTLLDHQQKTLPKGLKDRLLLAAQDKATTYEVSQLHFDLGRLYGRHGQNLKKKWHWDVAGLHGQTIHHHGKQASLQIGHPGFFATQTEKPVYFDFRGADIVAGGEGAPFAPFFQKQLRINQKLGTCAFHNLGGISNITYLHKESVTAFDTGPANILLDTWIQEKKKQAFDKNGQWSRKGLPDPKVVNQFLTHTYFKKRPPKSTGRELFNYIFIKKNGGRPWQRLCFEDQMATLAEVSALSIAKAYLSWCKTPLPIYFYGGGVKNRDLMKRIQFYLPDCQILSTSELGWDPQAFESSLIAFLAAARYFNIKVHWPQVTGAKSSMNLGSLYSP